MAIAVVILAAGQGKRMHSSIPKVLHPLAGKPILQHVIDTAKQVAGGRPPYIVYGHHGDKVRDRLATLDASWVQQSEQLGTGHALLQVLPHLREDDHVLVLYGDVPLISPETLHYLIASTPDKALGLLTAHLANPGSYGRIKRNKQGQVMQVIEEKDASEIERAINEINTGIYFLPTRYLQKWLPQLQNTNVQKEYYLTDIIALAVKEGVIIHTVQPSTPEEILGINDRIQLALLERFYQRYQAEKWMRQGVTISDPARFDVRGEVVIGRDTVIDANVILEGQVTIGKECVIGPQVVLHNVVLGDRVKVRANSMIEGAEIANDSIIGPFARVRPGTIIASGAHIGNFVEIKNSRIGEGSKVNHLSYIGDCDMGKRVNVGAGTITCNYDGVHKQVTTIGDDVFIGSDTQLVAPITLSEGTTIGAGSTVTKDTPAHQLILTHRLDQRSVKDWKRPQDDEDERK